MTYRDETLILREKLAEIETDGVRLEGRIAGLDVALAEAEDRERVATRELASLPIKRGARRFSARIMGSSTGRSSAWPRMRWFISSTV